MKKIKLPKMPSTSQLLWGAFSTFVLAYAVWLVSPFIKIEPADYLRAGRLARPAISRSRIALSPRSGRPTTSSLACWNC